MVCVPGQSRPLRNDSGSQPPSTFLSPVSALLCSARSRPGHPVQVLFHRKVQEHGRPGSGTCPSHFRGKDLVPWPQLAAGEAGICGPVAALEEKAMGSGGKLPGTAPVYPRPLIPAQPLLPHTTHTASSPKAATTAHVVTHSHQRPRFPGAVTVLSLTSGNGFSDLHTPTLPQTHTHRPTHTGGARQVNYSHNSYSEKRCVPGLW